MRKKDQHTERKFRGVHKKKVAVYKPKKATSDTRRWYLHLWLPVSRLWESKFLFTPQSMVLSYTCPTRVVHWCSHVACELTSASLGTMSPWCCDAIAFQFMDILCSDLKKLEPCFSRMVITPHLHVTETVSITWRPQLDSGRRKKGNLCSPRERRAQDLLLLH